MSIRFSLAKNTPGKRILIAKKSNLQGLEDSERERHVLLDKRHGSIDLERIQVLRWQAARTQSAFLCSIFQRLLEEGILRKFGAAHEGAVAFAGGAAAFVDGPDNQGLAAAGVTGRKDAGDAGGEAAVVGFDVGAGILLYL